MTGRYYLDMQDVLALHRGQPERFGGAPGIRDPGLIQAALAQPQSGYCRDLPEEAAATLQFVIGALEGRTFGKGVLEDWLRANTAPADS